KFKGDDFRGKVLFDTKFDAAEAGAAATTLTKGTPLRPPVKPGGWAGVAVTEPVPPKAWTAPPAGSWSKARQEPIVLPEWPAAFTETVGVVLRYVPHQKPVIRNELVCERYDLASGKRLGEPQVLWPWIINPLSDPEAKRTRKFATATTLPPAALTADGERLAVVDPGERHRVDIWNAAGARQTGFYAAAPGQEIAWLGWSAGGKLLSLAGGTLTAWDTTAARAVFAVHGGYAAPCDLARSRQWGVFA